MSLDNDEAQEYQAVIQALTSFLNFHNYQLETLIKPRVDTFNSLSVEDKTLIASWYQKHTSYLKEAIDLNGEFTKDLASKVAADWGIQPQAPEMWGSDCYTALQLYQLEKTQGILLQLMREWSDEGFKERQVGYNLIMLELEQLYPETKTRLTVNILVPGCGLGRLVFELVSKGFKTQGNDCDYHMLFTSNFILQHCWVAHNYSFFPFLEDQQPLGNIGGASGASGASGVGCTDYGNIINHSSRAMQLRPVTFPDVSPSARLSELQSENPGISYEDMVSITAGSFVELYGDGKDDKDEKIRKELLSGEKFDVIVTEFFLHTADNILDYIRTIRDLLKSGGKWINFGPLLYSTPKPSNNVLGFAREDLVELIPKLGFDFEKHESGIESTYCQDQRLLVRYTYQCDFWVCKKL